MSFPNLVPSLRERLRKLRPGLFRKPGFPRQASRGRLVLGGLLAWAGATQLTASEPATKRSPIAPESFARCSVCHGADATGNESLQAPNLSGREAWYLRRQLRAFKSYARGQTNDVQRGFLAPEGRTQQMHPIVTDLGWAEQRRLVRYLSRLDPPVAQPGVAGDRERGKALYAGCVECHGSRAEGKRWRGAPALTHLQAWYLENQLRDFRMGWRGADSKDIHVRLMRGQLDLDDARLKDLAAYIVAAAAEGKR